MQQIAESSFGPQVASLSHQVIPIQTDRRGFLKSSAEYFSAACAATMFSGTAAVCGIAAMAGATSATAADPIIRTGKPILKLSLAAYSFTRNFARRGSPEQIAAAKMSLEKFIVFCAEQQLTATELTGYYFPAEITTEYLLGIRQQVHRMGLSISGTAIGNDFCLPEGEARQKQIQECRQWIDYAAIMGAPAIRIFAGQVPQGDTEGAAIERCASAINECLKYAAERGVFLALENHGGITATPDQMLKIIQAVESSPWFGVNFDSGNFATADPYSDLERIAPYAVNAQIKVSIQTTGGKKQPADLKRIVSILRSSGYRGFVAFEYEEDEDPFTAVPRYLRELRDLMDA